DDVQKVNRDRSPRPVKPARWISHSSERSCSHDEYLGVTTATKVLLVPELDGGPGAGSGIHPICDLAVTICPGRNGGRTKSRQEQRLQIPETITDQLDLDPILVALVAPLSLKIRKGGGFYGTSSVIQGRLKDKSSGVSRAQGVTRKIRIALRA